MKGASAAPETRTVTFGGGLDLVTPASVIPPGRVIAGANYEVSAEGYRRMEGLERLDGRTKPSESSYSYMTFNHGNTALVAGQTVTGATSGATGVLLVDGALTSGTYGSGQAIGYLVLTAVTGTFASGENLQVGGVTKAASTSTANDRGAMNDTDDATWLAATVLRSRTAIQVVPGGGPVRGGWYFGGAVYAFRDDAAVTPTKCRMYKATASGWVLQSLGYSLPFTVGQAAGIVAGNTITGSISAATAVVSRVIITSGTFDANNAVGRLILSAVTGTFQAEDLKVAGSTRATIGAAPAANVIAPGGRYEFRTNNFYGATSQASMYAVNGVSPAFEWDGTIFTPILTGAADERPIHLACHKNHLWLAYRNGGLSGSQSGAPQGWDGTLGATAFGIGSDITGLMEELAGVLGIFTRNSIKHITGSIAADFALDPFTIDAGAVEWTLQTMGGPTYLDAGGVRNLTTSQAFGDFKVGTLTQLIQPLLDIKKKAGITPVASLRVREKAHYRLFFSDGTGISIYVGAKAPASLPFDYGTRVATCMSSCLDSNDQELLLMGCADGYLYQLDRGTSMDGDTLRAFLRPPFNHCGTPNQNKRFQNLSLQVAASPSAALFITAAFSDGDPDQPSVVEQSFNVRGGGGFWNEANWNNFYWSSKTIGKASAPIDGLGNNISPTFGTASSTEKPHTLSSMTLKFSMRGPVHDQ